jgi:hypothetical protein
MGKLLVLDKQIQGKKGGNLETKAGNHQTSHDLNTGMQTTPPGSRTDLCKPNKRTATLEQKKRDQCLINMGKYYHEKRKLALSTQ